MEGRTELRAKLIADSAVTALVGTYKGSPAIFDAPLTPDKYDDAAISMYLTSPTDGGETLGIFSNTVNCWATSYTVAENMQDAAFEALNRRMEGSDTFFKCSKQVIIPPQNTGGDYNAPLEVLVRQR